MANTYKDVFMLTSGLISTHLLFGQSASMLIHASSL